MTVRVVVTFLVISLMPESKFSPMLSYTFPSVSMP